MTSPDPGRRRALLWLAGGMTVLAGCGDTDRTTAAPSPPASPGAPETEPFGPGPDGGETPTETDPLPPGTGTPALNDVVYTKPGGGEVSATMYGDGDCAVVLVPQVNMDRQSWDAYARRLAAAGYRALAIDEGEDRKADGVAGSVTFLREETGVDTVVVVGASSGGEAAIQAAAAGTPAIDGVGALSPAGGADVASSVTVPLLVVVSEGDDARFVRTATDLANEAGGGSELVTYEGPAHGQGLFDSPHAAALRSRLRTFLDAVCTPETPGPTVPSPTE